jgi:hypothetical protein
MVSLHAMAHRGDASFAVKVSEQANLTWVDERQDGATCTGAGGTARTVQVVLRVVRRVEVDDQVDIVDVDAPSRNVSGYQHPGVACGKARKRPLALVLVEVAVDGSRRCTRHAQLASQPVRTMLGADEEQGASRPGSDLRGDVDLVGCRQHEDTVVSELNRRLGGGHRVDRGVLQVTGYEGVDPTVESGREQHALAVGQGLVEDLADVGQEAQVSHVVGLIEDGNGYPVEPSSATLHEVDEPARSRDDEVNAVTQRVDLTAHRGAAVNGGQPDADGARQRGKHVSYLAGELAGGHQDEATRRTLRTLARGLGEPSEQREAEAEGLAGTGLGTAEDIFSGERVRKGAGLDGERGEHPVLGERGDQRGRKTELSEGGVGRRGSLQSGIEREIEGGRL